MHRGRYDLVLRGRYYSAFMLIRRVIFIRPPRPTAKDIVLVRHGRDKIVVQVSRCHLQGERPGDLPGKQQFRRVGRTAGCVEIGLARVMLRPIGNGA